MNIAMSMPRIARLYMEVRKRVEGESNVLRLARYKKTVQQILIIFSCDFEIIVHEISSQEQNGRLI